MMIRQTSPIQVLKVTDARVHRISREAQSCGAVTHGRFVAPPALRTGARFGAPASLRPCWNKQGLRAAAIEHGYRIISDGTLADAIGVDTPETGRVRLRGGHTNLSELYATDKQTATVKYIFGLRSGLSLGADWQRP